MNSRSKEGKIIRSVSLILCLLSLVSCTKPPKSSVEEYQGLLQKLESREIKTVEILCIPYEVDMEAPQTVENLRNSYWYKITINFPYGLGKLEDAMLKFSPKEETTLENNIYRLGLLFFDKNKKEVYSMYFSIVAPKVRIGDKMFTVSEDILNSITPFIPDPSRMYFEKLFNSWFPRKSEEATK